MGASQNLQCKPYADACRFVVRSDGAGTEAIASILLSLYNGSDYVCGLGSALGRLDTANRALALRVISEFAAHGETQDLRDAVAEMFERRPELFERCGHPKVVIEVRGGSVTAAFANARELGLLVLNHNTEGIDPRQLRVIDAPNGDIVQVAAHEIECEIDPVFVANVERTLARNFGREGQSKYRF